MTRTGRSKKGKGSPCASELVQYVTGDKRPDQTPPICFCGGLCVVFIALFLFPPTRLNGIAQSHSAQKAPICCKNSLESLTCHLRCVLHRTQRFLGGVPTYSGPHTLSQGLNEICTRHKAQREGRKAHTLALRSVIAFDVTLTVSWEIHAWAGIFFLALNLLLLNTYSDGTQRESL